MNDHVFLHIIILILMAQEIENFNPHWPGIYLYCLLDKMVLKVLILYHHLEHIQTKHGTLLLMRPYIRCFVPPAAFSKIFDLTLHVTLDS